MKSSNNAVGLRTAHEAKNECRLFISSTFRDMMAEREHLVKHVLPAVRAFCRERGLQCTEVDLRWGITAEQARQGRIVGICLDELHDHLPFFIGILGSRYGWIPEAGEFEKQPDVLRRYPWLLRAVQAGRSIVEMEMVEGVLHNPGMAGRAIFYVRDPAVDRLRVEPESSETAARLAELKWRIRTSGFPMREGFTCPEMLGRWVLEDLCAMIDRHHPRTDPGSRLEAERRSHEAFAATRRRAYVEHPETIARLERHVAADDGPLVITGESGAGKSALLAYWSRWYRERYPDAFLVTHYVGVGAAGSDHYALLLRIMGEIKERYAIADPLPMTAEAIELAFPVWLAYVQKEPMILALDALNQLDARSLDLAWLPQYFPPRVRLMVTAPEGTVLDALRDRSWEELRVQPLTLAERADIVRSFLGEHGKALDAEQEQRVSADPASANPLFLRTRLEELRAFGSHEELNRKITHYLEAQGLDDLFQRVLARFEADYGRELVVGVMTAIWAARRGLSAAELAPIVDRKPEEIARVLLALDYHLMNRAGLLTFFHEHLRNAVEQRYLETVGSRRQARLWLASYFTSGPPDERRAEELPWLLAEAEAWPELAAAISDVGMFTELWKEPRRYELTRYWVALSPAHDPEDLYAAALTADESASADPAPSAEVLTALGNFFGVIARHGAAERYLKRALEHLEGVLRNPREAEAETVAYATLMVNYASVQSAMGDHLGALETMERSAEILLRCAGRQSREYAWSCEQRAQVAWAARDYDAAGRLYAEYHEIMEGERGDDVTDRIVYARGLGALYYAKREYPMACHHFADALAALRQRHGAEHPDVANVLNNLGAAYAARELFKEAAEFVREAITICERLFGPEHPEIASYLMNLGYLYKRGGEPAAAEETYRRALAQRKRILGDRHPDYARDLVNLATLLKEQGRLAEALEISREALDIRTEMLGADHRDTTTTQLHIASILKDMGELEAAHELYAEYLPIEEQALGIEHPHTQIFIRSHAQVLHRMGRIKEARRLESRLPKGKAMRASLD